MNDTGTVGDLVLFAFPLYAGAIAMFWVGLRLTVLAARIRELEDRIDGEPVQRCRVCGGDVDGGECERCGVRVE